MYDLALPGASAPAPRSVRRGGAKSVASRATTANNKKPLLEQTFKDEAEKHTRFSSRAVAGMIAAFVLLEYKPL